MNTNTFEDNMDTIGQEAKYGDEVIINELPGIPKIIHQTFSSSLLPPLYKQCQHYIRNIYNEYTYCFYSDNDIESFMKENFPVFKKNTFDKLPAKIMKIDTFRYCLMYKIGGIYSDMDYQVTKRFNFENYNLVLPISHSQIQNTHLNTTSNNGHKIDDDFVLGNCFFASQALHPFWGKAIEELSGNIDIIISDFPSKRNLTKYKKYILNTTGPGFLTQIYKKYFISDTSIYLPPKHFFHPNRNDSPIFGYHHCTGTWLFSKDKK